MKFTKAIVLPVASALLVVVGAGAVFAATSPVAPADNAPPAAEASTAPAPATSSAPVAPYLKSVLDPLVAGGTITSAQEQAIIDAWAAKRDELKAVRQQLRAFLADGVLTADELAQLPADSPLQQLKPLMTNGQITVAQMRALGRGIIRELRMGGVLNGALSGGATTPAPSPSSGG